jgi:hypothetical protein
MQTKDQILGEIRRTANENGGKPLGTVRFENETGIKPYDWGKYWSRFGDALQDAGFAPNTLNTSYDDEYILGKWVALARELQRFPTSRDLRLKRHNDPDFPGVDAMLKFGSQHATVIRVSEYATNNGYEDVVRLCAPILKKSTKLSVGDPINGNECIGEVYLFKSGRYFKIGKTTDRVRRGTELKVQLPEKLDLIHSIMTDDPSGVEAYWHRRFESKRMKGEWFDLGSADVKAFKRWRKIV